MSSVSLTRNFTESLLDHGSRHRSLTTARCEIRAKTY